MVIDVGFKSEGSIPRSEWEAHEQQPEVGDEIQVLVEDLEDESGRADDPHGLIAVSKRKADHIIHWRDVISNVAEGDIVTGTSTRKIKGGLLVDIGVPVFLPASQVDIRRPGDIGEFIGRVVQCEVLKIDEQRRNIVVSRRSLIEKERSYAQQKLMSELEVGQVRKGTVKNIADFGAFVDLGGIDGLLAHYGYVAYAHQSPVRKSIHGRGNRSQSTEHRSRKDQDRTGPETTVAESMG